MPTENDIEVNAAGFYGYADCMFETCPTPYRCSERGECDVPDEGTNLSACDYYQGIGTCTFGCYEEPSCFTDQPREGWPKIDRTPYAEFLLAARRYDRRVENWCDWQVVRRHAL